MPGSSSKAPIRTATGSPLSRGPGPTAAPPDDAPAAPWRFRAADLDLAGHVNNAVYWQVLEEELVPAEPVAAVDAEIEYRAAGGPGEAAVVADDGMRWITAAGAVLATVRVAGD